MARQQTDPRSTIIQSANKSGKEAREAFEFDLNRRLGDQGKILTADDMSGLYEPKRGLFTTIDGKPRMLTWDDIKAFKAAVNDIQRRHGQQRGGKSAAESGGILAKQVVDLSNPDDRKRANSEIHTCFPVINRAGLVHFQTNAGPNSKVTRHHVMVQFLGYDSALSGGLPVAEAAKLLGRGKIKFDCDCERHTFWFRYIASVGNFNYGRPEDGFPRVRNPKLYGIACKHVLRVMATITHGPTFDAFARRMLENGRKTLSNRRQTLSVKEQQEFIEKASKTRKRDRTVATSDEKRESRAGQPAQKVKAAARMRAANDSLRKTHAAKVNKPVPEGRKIKVLMDMGYSREAALAAIAAADKAQG
ncbi:hypothetical protein [Pseudomonas lurida]|uniref:hypothetical protein n=1 Tax=Pseudomonas lurida TaxID=244566 RepID=UPI00177C919C|nr:hypothetical protein [Pseudomonas lurida]MBD8671611.1 hypothetical protein [Pseudomonas lurida]